ncbi:MAG: GLUG motif-containing protein [Betaproteobacteria bacterium]
MLLAAGSQVNLVDTYRPDIQVSLSAPAGGEALNVGQLVGGQVGIYAAAIRQQGAVQATGAQVGAGGEIIFSASRTLDVAPGASVSADGLAGGRIRLQAGDTAQVAGTVSATGSAGAGGRVEVLGRHVGVLDGARIDVSGAIGGGSVYVGGGLRGADGALPNARALWFGPQASIRADATGAGQGGTVVLWSDEVTRAYGSLSARGGAAGGNGGFVEVSSRGQLVWGGTADTRAQLGLTGTLLFDPTNIWIATDQASATQAGMVGSDNSASTGGGIPFTFQASGTPSDSLLTVAALQAALGSNHVIVTTSSAGGGAGDINVVDGFSWSANTLTLSADRDININAVITAGGSSVLSLNPGTGSVKVGFNADGSFKGRVDFPGRSGTGFFTIGGLDYTVINALGNPGSITALDLQGMNGDRAGRYALGSNINASATSTWNSGAGFSPVGTDSFPFTGKFNGLGHTVSGLYIRRNSQDYIGLFGYVNTGADLRNVGLLGGDVEGKAFVGALAGLNGGVITRSFAATDVTNTGIAFIGPDGYAGGLVGLNKGTIRSSFATGAVTGNSALGGLAGSNFTGTIEDSFATGSVTRDPFLPPPDRYVGGLTGYNASGTIRRSFSTGGVQGTGGTTDVGGLVGYGVSGTVIDSFWDEQASGQLTSGSGGPGGFGKTTTEMQDPATFIAAGWVAAVWRLRSGAYPTLQAFNGQCIVDVCWDGGAGTHLWFDAANWTGNVLPTSDQSIFIGTRPDPVVFDSTGTYAALTSEASLTVQGTGTSLSFTGTGQRPLPRTVAFGSGTTLLLNGGTLTLYAATSLNHFTINGGAAGGAGSVSIASTFSQTGGNWQQISPTLPAFYAANFALSGGTFLRAAGGDGTALTPYLIGDVYGLQGMASVNLLDKRFHLTTDIAAGITAGWNSGTGFRPIGYGADPFTGTFDGQGHSIDGLIINRPLSDDVGLFGRAGPGASIRNVDLAGGSVTGHIFAGALVGFNAATVTNSHASLVNVAGYSDTGGLVGQNVGTVSNSSASGNVSAAFGTGGLVGYNSSGGVVTGSHALGLVSGSNRFTGGLVGYSWNSTVTNSYASGSVLGNTETGGLVGLSESSTVMDTYATGSVMGNNRTGGLIGHLDAGSLSNSYATGSVAGAGQTGGLVGRRDGGTVDASFWLKPSDGSRNGLDNGIGTGKTELQMTDPLTFTSAGWSTTAWAFTPGDYPALLAVTACSSDVCWDGGAGTFNWFDAANWTGDALPNASQSIFINALANPVLFDQPGSYAFNNLSSDASLTVSPSGSLTLDFNGLVSFGSGTVFAVNGASTVINFNGATNLHHFTLSDGNINATGVVSIAGTFSQLGGYWQQVSPSLPAFSAQNFALTAGSFLRAKGGDGTDGNPYLISDVYGLQGMASQLGGRYKLANDIDATSTENWNSGKGFRPIGDSTSDFSGKFDGDHKVISGLFINRSTEDHVGLFGKANLFLGDIRNVGLADVNVTGKDFTGALVGQARDGSVFNSYADGTVSGGNNTGGLVGGGPLGSLLVNSFYSADTMVINGSTGVITPGAVYGAQFTTWLNNGKTLNATTFFGPPVGGYYVINTVSQLKDLLGFATAGSGLKFRLGSDLDLSGNPNFYVPQLAIGELDGAGHTLSNLSIERPNISTMGFIGRIFSGTVKNLNLQNISVTGLEYVGGVTGENAGTLSNISSSGSVTGLGEYTGGLVGWNASGTVVNSTASGSVTSVKNTGGLVGYNTSNGVVANSFYDVDAVAINGDTGVVSIGGLYSGQFTDWINNGKTLNATTYFGAPVGGYYIIDSVDDLKNLLGFATAGGGLKFRLGNDLDLAGLSHFFVPQLAVDELNGDGYVIRNLTILRPDDSAIGFIGRIISGTVKNIGVENVNVSGYQYAGGLAGINGGTISDSYATGSVFGGPGVGGLVGWQRAVGVITKARAAVSVAGNTFVGGLVGDNEGTLTNTYATGGVTGTANVGGLLGRNSFGGTVSNSYSTGTVLGSTSTGGLVGTNWGLEAYSFWDMGTSGSTTSAGGEGKATLEMKNPATFTTAGWSTSDWNFAVGAYPVLRPSSVPCVRDVCWDGGAGTFNWFDAANWTGNALPTASQSIFINALANPVLFSGTGSYASLASDASFTVGSGSVLTFTGGVSFSSGTTFTIQGGTVNFNAGGNTLHHLDIAAAGRLNLAGSTTLGGMSTISGVVGLSGTLLRNTGTLGLMNAGSIELSGASTLENAAAAVMTLSGSSAQPVTYLVAPAGKLFHNAGVLNKTSSTAQTIDVAFENAAGSTLNLTLGSLSLTSFPTNSGQISIAAGATLGSGGAALLNAGGATIAGAGTMDLGTAILTNNGTVQPGGAGTAGTLDIIGSYTQGPGGTLVIDLGGMSPGQYDKLSVLNTATLGGTLQTAFITSYTGNDGDTFTQVVTASSVIGTFAAINPPAGFSISPTLGPTFFDMALDAPCPVDVCWTGGSGLWSTGSNWSTGLAPTVGQRVRISRPGDLTITVSSGTQYATDLFSEENLMVSAGSLILAGAAGLTGSLTLSGGSLELAAGASATASALTLSGGTFLANGNISTAAFVLSGSVVLAGGGAFSVTNSFSQSGGTISHTGNLNITQGSGVLNFNSATVGGLALVANSGGIQLAGTIIASGNVVLTGQGVGAAEPGVSLVGVLSTSGSGSIQINGTAGTSAAGSAGVHIDGSVQAANGNITIQGNRGTASSGDLHVGVALDGATVKTTGAGDISISGGGAATGATTDNLGVLLSGSTIRALGSGRVSLAGTAAGNTAGGNYGVSLQAGSEVSSTAAVFAAVMVSGAGAAGDAGVHLSGAGNNVLATGMGGGVSLISTTGAIEIGTSDAVTALNGALSFNSVGGLNQAPGSSLIGGTGLNVMGGGLFSLKGTGSFGGTIALAGPDVRFQGGSHSFADGAVVIGTLNVDGAGVLFGTGSVDGLALSSGSVAVSAARTLVVANLSQSGGLIDGPGSLDVTNSYARSGGAFGGAWERVSIRQASGDLEINTNLAASQVSLTAAAGALRVRDAMVVAAGDATLSSAASTSVLANGTATGVSGARVTVNIGGNLTLQGGSASGASASIAATAFECGGTVAGDLVLNGGTGTGAHAVLSGFDIGRPNPGEFTVRGSIAMNPETNGHARIQSTSPTSIHLSLPNHSSGGYTVAGSPVVSMGQSGFFAGPNAAVLDLNLLIRYGFVNASAVTATPVLVEINNLSAGTTVVSPFSGPKPRQDAGNQDGDDPAQPPLGRCL